MSFLRLVCLSRSIARKKTALLSEKQHSLENRYNLETDYSLEERFSHKCYRCRKNIRKLFSNPCNISKTSWPRRTWIKLRSEGTIENYICRSLIGFASGFLLTFLFFMFFVLLLNFKLYTATIMCSVIGFILTIGLAFSSNIRCIVLLFLPQFFTKRGRQALIAYAVILAITGPAKNTLHNLGTLSESMACGQEQLKEALGKIVDAVRKPFYAIKESIKTAVQSIKEVVKKLKDMLLKLKRIIMSLLKVIQSAFDFLGKVVNFCNKKVGTPFQRCTRVFENAINDCNAKLGPLFNWLCSVTYLGKAVCYLVKIFDYVCLLIDFLSDSIIGVVKQKLKIFMRHVKTMFYVRIKFSHSYHFEMNQSKSVHDVAQGILSEIRHRTEEIIAVFDIMSLATSLFFIFIIIKALYYRKKFLTNERFDNHFITKHFRQIDFQRAKLGKETVLPLNHRERNKYIVLSSCRLVSSEKRTFCKAAVILLLVSFKLATYMMIDYALFWMLSLIRHHAKYQSPIDAPDFPTFHVSGNGFLADLLRAIVNALQPAGLSLQIDTVPCLPDPIPPDYDRYIQMALLLLLCWLLVVLEPYGLRLRHYFMCYYYPDRAKERAVWLYNNVIRNRSSFLKFARRQLRRKFFGSSKITQVTFRERLQAKISCKFLRYILCLGSDHQDSCLLCGEVFRDTDKNLPILCKTPDCPGKYCDKCFKDLKNMCTICMDPLDYGDYSDISEEKDSSDEEIKKQKTLHKQTVNEIRFVTMNKQSYLNKQESNLGEYDISEFTPEMTSSDTDYSYSYQLDKDLNKDPIPMVRSTYADLEKQYNVEYASMDIFRSRGNYKKHETYRTQNRDYTLTTEESCIEISKYEKSEIMSLNLISDDSSTSSSSITLPSSDRKRTTLLNKIKNKFCKTGTEDEKTPLISTELQEELALDLSEVIHDETETTETYYSETALSSNRTTWADPQIENKNKSNQNTVSDGKTDNKLYGSFENDNTNFVTGKKSNISYLQNDLFSNNPCAKHKIKQHTCQCSRDRSCGCKRRFNTVRSTCSSTISCNTFDQSYYSDYTPLSRKRIRLKYKKTRSKFKKINISESDTSSVDSDIMREIEVQRSKNKIFPNVSSSSKFSENVQNKCYLQKFDRIKYEVVDESPRLDNPKSADMWYNIPVSKWNLYPYPTDNYEENTTQETHQYDSPFTEYSSYTSNKIKNYDDNFYLRRRKLSSSNQDLSTLSTDLSSNVTIYPAYTEEIKSTCSVPVRRKTGKQIYEEHLKQNVFPVKMFDREKALPLVSKRNTYNKMIKNYYSKIADKPFDNLSMNKEGGKCMAFLSKLFRRKNIGDGRPDYRFVRNSPNTSDDNLSQSVKFSSKSKKKYFISSSSSSSLTRSSDCRFPKREYNEEYTLESLDESLMGQSSSFPDHQAYMRGGADVPISRVLDQQRVKCCSPTPYVNEGLFDTDSSISIEDNDTNSFSKRLRNKKYYRPSKDNPRYSTTSEQHYLEEIGQNTKGDPPGSSIAQDQNGKLVKKEPSRITVDLFINLNPDKVHQNQSAEGASSQYHPSALQFLDQDCVCTQEVSNVNNTECEKNNSTLTQYYSAIDCPQELLPPNLLTNKTQDIEKDNPNCRNELSLSESKLLHSTIEDNKKYNLNSIESESCSCQRPNSEPTIRTITCENFDLICPNNCSSFLNSCNSPEIPFYAREPAEKESVASSSSSNMQHNHIYNQRDYPYQQTDAENQNFSYCNCSENCKKICFSSTHNVTDDCESKASLAQSVKYNQNMHHHGPVKGVENHSPVPDNYHPQRYPENYEYISSSKLPVTSSTDQRDPYYSSSCHLENYFSEAGKTNQPRPVPPSPNFNSSHEDRRKNCCESCRCGNNGKCTKGLPYQNSDDYNNLVNELDEKLYMRNKQRVMKTMHEFEKHSRQNKSLDRPILDDSDFGDNNSPRKNARNQMYVNSQHQRHDSFNDTYHKSDVSPPPPVPPRKSSRIPTDINSRYDSPPISRHSNYEHCQDIGRTHSHSNPQRPSSAAQHGAGHVERIAKYMDPNAHNRVQKYPKFCNRSESPSRWKLNCKNEWVKVSGSDCNIHSLESDSERSHRPKSCRDPTLSPPKTSDIRRHFDSRKETETSQSTFDSSKCRRGRSRSPGYCRCKHCPMRSGRY